MPTGSQTTSRRPQTKLNYDIASASLQIAGVTLLAAVFVGALIAFPGGQGRSRFQPLPFVMCGMVHPPHPSRRCPTQVNETGFDAFSEHAESNRCGVPSPGVGVRARRGAVAWSLVRFVVPVRGRADETQRSERQRVGIASKHRDHHVTKAAARSIALPRSCSLSRCFLEPGVRIELTTS